MLRIGVWDEIDCNWNERELDLPSSTKDPNVINRALIDVGIVDGNGDGWEVKNSGWCGPILTIETRSDRNHLGILIVNYEDQER